MLQRLKNLWAWSLVDPYTLGTQTAQAIIESLPPQPAEIVYPNKVTEVLRDNPEASLDDLITR